MPRSETLGQAVHRVAHLTIQLRHDPNFPLPTLASTSIMAMGHARPASSPPDSWVDAIDRRAGLSDEPESATEYRARLEKAMLTLQEWDEISYRCVTQACIKSRVQFLTPPNPPMRHGGKLFDEAVVEYFDGEKRTMDRRLEKAWDLLGLLLAPSAVRERAAAMGRTDAGITAWLEGRGLL